MSTETSPPRPYVAYAAITSIFLGGIALAEAGARRQGRPRRRETPFDLVVLALATFKLARTVARDDVASFIRMPFVEQTAAEGEEHAVSTGGARQALGELVTCSRCVGTWAAAGLVVSARFAPRFTRTLRSILAVGGANDWLQAGFAALTRPRSDNAASR